MLKSILNVALQLNKNCVCQITIPLYVTKSCAVSWRSFQAQFHTSRRRSTKKEEKNIIVFNEFEGITEKSKNNFLEMIKLYESRHKQRRGHVEFIYSAMKHMEEFGVEKDLATYKALIDVMPKGKMIPTNLFQVEFMHYPKQQQCIIDLLEQMEDNGVIPDADMEEILLNIFGKRGFPLRKYWRMMYWMPKFKNLSPWKIPNPPPSDALELAKLAIHRITSVDLRTTIDEYHSKDVEDSNDKTWIVSAISPIQIDLLNKHQEGKPIIVEGGGRVWLRSKCVSYFVMKSDPPPDRRPPEEDMDDVSNLKIPLFNRKRDKKSDEIVPARTVHEQDDGVVFAVCATGTSSKDSALSWIRLLQKHKVPALEKYPILFRFREPAGDLVPFTDSVTEKHSKT